MTELNIRQLMSGGLITNYFCTSRCGHCLYNCSPNWEKEYITAQTAANCYGELSSTSHFHIDLFGNYIPGLCSGLSISVEDLAKPLSAETYPILICLYRFGIRGLTNFAKEIAGFSPQKNLYINKCDLCTEIRTFLVQNDYHGSEELNPAEFYAKG